VIHPACAALIVLFAMCAAPVAAQRGDTTAAAAAIYRRYAAQVVRIEVVEQSSAAKSGVGSGFFVTAAGHIVTNYHVIASLVTDPDRYRAQITSSGKQPSPLHLVGIDVVHDLAVLTSSIHPPAFISPAPVTISIGTRLYSLGHPLDLGLSVVEGTYNGLVDSTLYPKIHFTGAINPGMSGGPVLTAFGALVGVNVSTEDDEVGFLVPADRARALLTTVLAPDYRAPTAFLPVVSRQLRDYQDTYLPQLFSDSTPSITLGPYAVPTRPGSFFRCWADATDGRTTKFRRTDHRCSTEDAVFISDEQSSGLIAMHHELLTSTALGRVRFTNLVGAHLADRGNATGGLEEDVTSYRCETRNVRSNRLTFRATLCIRAYRKLDGFYDARFVAVTLGGAGTALISTLNLTGVTFDNAERTTRGFLRRIRWAS
jgi:S1-C subfamily serine protease